MRFSPFYELRLPRPWDAGAEQRLIDEALAQIELAMARPVLPRTG